MINAYLGSPQLKINSLKFTKNIHNLKLHLVFKQLNWLLLNHNYKRKLSLCAKCNTQRSIWFILLISNVLWSWNYLYPVDNSSPRTWSDTWNKRLHAHIELETKILPFFFFFIHWNSTQNYDDAWNCQSTSPDKTSFTITYFTSYNSFLANELCFPPTCLC